MKKLVIERLSIFDIFKIGVGPSSSHTLGPWRAALQFIELLHRVPFNGIRVHLYGSLSKTGKGHATDIAILLGLQGFLPDTIDTDNIQWYVDKIHSEKRIEINGRYISFDHVNDIIYEDSSLAFHPNGMKICAMNGEEIVLCETYFSIGGGFVLKENQQNSLEDHPQLPYPIDYGSDLAAHIDATGLAISDIVMANELVFRTKQEVEDKILKIYQTMQECAYRGAHTPGVLPGGLNVRRRAMQLNADLLGGKKEYTNPEEWIDVISTTDHKFVLINKWVSCFALAVNEQNAALGRVVTSPTNGAAGVIPAVLFYHRCFGDYQGLEDIMKFFLTAGEIGCMFKKGATISAAEGGCQAEIGVSSAMAAGALTELMGGTPKQVLMAAEIAIEHHLGLTCDPIGGLVQVPCIERNTMGAMKAITAANLAISSEPAHAIVDFDTAVRTMWETANDMHLKYKETSEGGLAINLPVIMPNC